MKVAFGVSLSPGTPLLQEKDTQHHYMKILGGQIMSRFV